jgi:lysophospholipase L1-like esterase
MLLGALATAVAIGLQALVVRRRIPRLPVAQGMQSGCVRGSQDERLRLLVIGESTAVGVGVQDQRDGLAAQVAAMLGQSMGTVWWQARGRIGATARATNESLSAEPACDAADVVIVLLGVNDTLKLSTPVHWYRELRDLQHALQRRTGCRLILLAPVPPLWKFKCLPQPLRAFVGLHAFVLDRAVRLLAANRRDTLLYVPMLLGDQQTLLARDRFHPSRAGYAVLARHFAVAIQTAWRQR